MRPAWNRPEMLQLSIEYELEARKYHKFSSDLMGVFVLDYGYDDKMLEIIDNYPDPKMVIKRERRLGLTVNILEGLKESFTHADDYVIYIEDDMLIHKTYFKFMDVVMDIADPNIYSLIIGYSKGIHNKNGNFDNPSGDINSIRRDHAYAAFAPLIRKEFFNNYVLPCITPTYYKDFGSRDKFVVALADKYKDDKRFKYRDSRLHTHNEQAGLINRLVDVAFIEEGLYTLRPEITRTIHIGFYGKNRAGKLPGESFEKRLKVLRNAVDNHKLYELTGSKQYNDYEYFTPKLDDWDGTLYIWERT